MNTEKMSFLQSSLKYITALTDKDPEASQGLFWTRGPDRQGGRSAFVMHAVSVTKCGPEAGTRPGCSHRETKLIVAKFFRFVMGGPTSR